MTEYVRKPLPVVAFEVPIMKGAKVTVDINDLESWPEWMRSFWTRDEVTNKLMLKPVGANQRDGTPSMYFARMPNAEGVYDLVLRSAQGVEMVVQGGDFIVEGSQGEVYPVSRKAFLATHAVAK